MICKAARKKLIEMNRKEKLEEMKQKEREEEWDCFEKGICPKCASSDIDFKTETSWVSYILPAGLFYRITNTCNKCKYSLSILRTI